MQTEFWQKVMQALQETDPQKKMRISEYALRRCFAYHQFNLPQRFPHCRGA